MHLYSLTLQKATAIAQAITGSFSAPKQYEIVASRGKILELLKVDENGKLHSISSTEVFGTIRSIVPFRITGGNNDYIVVGSDSGAIVILEYNAQKNVFVRVHHEVFGKTGCRRIVPGQYLAVDPKGRAVMIGAVEKQKFVYVLNRDAANRLTISSPLEAHKSHTVCYSLVGVDVGFENPIFAAIELDHSDADQDSTGKAAEEAQKVVTFYELDLGLNNVVRKWYDPVDRSAHLLIAVPGGADGPSGVLICSENYITYKNMNHPDVKAPIPRRNDMNPERGLMIVSAATHKQKSMFFFLLQSELGDLYKVTLDYTGGEVRAINISYFDTVPISNSVCLLRNGFLFVASEFSNHKLYQFKGLGDESDMTLVGYYQVGEEEYEKIPLFRPRPIKNLELTDELHSLSPIIDFKVMDHFSEGTNKQLFCLCGRGPQSSLRVLRHGLALSELARSDFPGNPNAVWTVKTSKADQFDRYIVVSFVNATVVLSIGETVEEVTDSGLQTNSPTLIVAQIGDDSLVQVHPQGIRHIRADKRVAEWPAPGKKTIVKAAVNERQVVIALGGGQVIHFELDAPVNGNLIEVDKKDMGQDIACLDVGPIPSGRQRSRFLAVGFYDRTVRILSLDPDDSLAVLSRQALPAEPSSLSIVEMRTTDTPGADSFAFYLNIGLHNGVILRSVLDSVTGELSDTRTRFLGPRPVKLIKVRIQDSTAVLALSARAWLLYNYQSRFHMTPLSATETFEAASHFSSEHIYEGIVTISGNSLIIYSIDRLGVDFNQTIIPLKCTPRRFVTHPQNKSFIIIETDHNAYTDAEKQKIQQETKPQSDDMDTDMQDEEPQLPEAEFGVPKPQPNSGKWASYIRIYDPTRDETTDMIELDNNEAAFSIAVCTFPEYTGTQEPFLVVGTAQDMTLYPRTCKAGWLHTYRFIDNGRRLELIHKTQLEDVPTALHPFQGRVLVGMRNILRIYDMGKKKLLRKCENKTFPNLITSVHAQGDRIYVGDITESFHFVQYRRSENILHVFADDTMPRWLTAALPLDYDTMAGGDKFGNVYVCRLPQELLQAQQGAESELGTEEVEGSMRWIWDRGLAGSAPYKAEEIIQFHVGDNITGFAKQSLMPGGAEVLLYGTIMGAVGALAPFTTKDDVDFFTLLEMHMRQENPMLLGRDHLAYRSYYVPVKHVIDGDLCEQFVMLDAQKQKAIAAELDRTPQEVAKKLEDMRNRIM